MTWIVARIHYHGDGRDELLLDCVGPLLDSLAERGVLTDAYFQRHWLRGPHVALYGLVERPGAIAAFRTAVDAAAGEYVVQRPSRASLDEHGQQAAHDLLAGLELRAGPALPLHPDNQVDHGEDDVEPGAYGGPAGLATARRFLSGSSRLALRQLATRRSEVAADVLALLVMTARYLRDAEGNRWSYLSYRSHAEGFLNAFDRDGGLREAFERNYRDQRADVLDLVAPYVSSAPVPEAVEGWHRLVDDLYPGILADVTSGVIDPPADYRERAESIGRPERYRTPAAASEFHVLAGRNSGALAFGRTPAFRARRFLVSLVYQGLVQLGLSPLQKYLVCHLIANGIDELTGRSWREILTDGAADA